ncbi:MAG: LEA type 2 family protein [Candidatus Thermoplasmatota archaeon]|nr:LEA type 2 family protein [Candidatus Thermoplasmatota archaeon]
MNPEVELMESAERDIPQGHAGYRQGTLSSGKKIFILVVIVILVLGVILAASFQEPSIKSVRLSSASILGRTLNVDVLVHNPNMIGGRVEKIDLDIYINDEYVGHISERQNVEVPAQGDVVLPLRIQIQSLPGYTGGPVVAEVRGTVTVAVLISFDVDVQEKAQIMGWMG